MTIYQSYHIGFPKISGYTFNLGNIQLSICFHRTWCIIDAVFLFHSYGCSSHVGKLKTRKSNLELKSDETATNVARLIKTPASHFKILLSQNGVVWKVIRWYFSNNSIIISHFFRVIRTSQHCEHENLHDCT